MRQGKSAFRIYFLLCLCMFVPLGLFVLLCLYYFPKRLAVTIIGFAGLFFMVAGPFWAMMLEKRLRDKFEKKQGKGKNVRDEVHT